MALHHEDYYQARSCLQFSVHSNDFGNKIEICFGQVFGIQLMFFYFEVDSLNFPLHLQTHGLAEYIAQVRTISFPLSIYALK